MLQGELLFMTAAGVASDVALLCDENTVHSPKGPWHMTIT